MNLPYGEEIQSASSGTPKDLIAGVKTISKILNPDTDLSVTDQKIEALAERVRNRDSNSKAVRDVFLEEGFGGIANGEQQDYHHSDISHVLDHRQGLPIANAMLVQAICQLNEISCYGVNFPGVFLIAVEDDVIEPITFTVLDYAKMVQDATKSNLSPPTAPKAASNRETLGRMFNNLQGIALSKSDYVKALEFVDYMGVITPNFWFLHQQRALIWFLMGDSASALGEVQLALKYAPDQKTREFIQTWRDGVAGNSGGDPLVN